MRPAYLSWVGFRLCWIAVLALAAVWIPADAVTFGVKPAHVTIGPQHPAAQIAFSSLFARTAVFDVTAKRWTQVQNTDALAPAGDILIVPPVFSIAPYGTALLRIAFRGAMPAPTVEQSYQITITQVLAAAGSAPPAFMVPLFIPGMAHTGAVRYTLHATKAGPAQLGIDNQSGVHVYIGKLSVESGGKNIYSGKLGVYVLAGSSRQFALSLTSAPSSEAEITFEDDEGSSQSATASVVP